MHESIYEPAEDSFLLANAVEKYVFGRVLDMGTGSGIQALRALKKEGVRKVVAVDIKLEVIKHLQAIKKGQKLSKLQIIQSDLFQNIPPQKLDVIIFNAPYLPQGKGDVDNIALFGGKQGWEISARFFEQVGEYLAPGGIILYLFSTLTNKKKVEEILRKSLFEWDEVALQKIAWETLYVYKIMKSPVLVELEGQKIRSLKYYSQGKRGVVYCGLRGRKKVAIKVQRSDSASLAALEREAQMLKVVNAAGIGSGLLGQGKDYIVMDFVDGVLFEEWIGGATRPLLLGALRDILLQCYVLDRLGITKEEMHHPFKHIIISSQNKVVFLDFERARRTDHPTNVTQVVEYFCRIAPRLQERGVVVDRALLQRFAGEYKKSYSKSAFDQILSSF